MLCNFHSVPTKPWIPPPVFHGKPQVGKNLWQKPVVISSRTYTNNPKEYPNSIGGVWVRHWCQQLKEKKHFKFKVRPSWFVFFQFWGMVKQNGHIPSTLKLSLGITKGHSNPSLLPIIPSPFTVTCRHPWGLGILTKSSGSWSRMRLWKQGFLEKWQSFHSFQLLALRKSLKISNPKFFFTRI